MKIEFIIEPKSEMYLTNIHVKRGDDLYVEIYSDIKKICGAEYEILKATLDNEPKQ